MILDSKYFPISYKESITDIVHSTGPYITISLKKGWTYSTILLIPRSKPIDNEFLFYVAIVLQALFTRKKPTRKLVEWESK